MNAKTGNFMIILGLLAMAFYGTMMGLGIISSDILPHFVITSVLFLSSGRMMRKAARAMVKESEGGQENEAEKEEPDWPFLTGLLNWTAALMIIGLMAIFLMKPIGVTFEEALQVTKANDHFFATSIP